MEPNTEKAEALNACGCTWIYNVVDKQTFFQGTFAISYCPLHAAAPDLRDALGVLIEHASEQYPHFESERGQRDLAQARAAYAKAKAP